ncbi:MAG: asparagine synthase, partial [Legionella sp.]
HNLVLTAGEVPGLLDRFFDDVDQPSVDGLNTWLISRAAVSLGLKVALSGLGGDEMLAGYPSFKQAPFAAGFGRWLPGQKFMRERVLPTLGPAIGRHLSTPKWPALLGYTDGLAPSYLMMKALFLPYELPALMGAEAAYEGLRLWDLDEQLTAENAQVAGWKPLAAVSYLESTHYMRNQLLRDSDWAGMGHSLEIRTPLVDRDVLRAAAGALQSGAVTNKRAVVRQMLPELEAQILNKPKTGFTLPKNHWLQTQPGLDAWRQVPLLTAGNTYGGRRWAYVVAQRMGLV